MNVFRLREQLLIALVVLPALMLAVLWFVQEQQNWRALQAERLIQQNRYIAVEDLMEVIAAVANAEPSIMSGTHLHTHSLLASRLAVMLDAQEQQLPEQGLFDPLTLRRQALDSLEKTLAREPADAHAWARLAYLRQGFGASPQAVIEALRMSVYLAPASHSLLHWRLRMAAPHMNHWDHNFTTLMESQMSLAWRAHPRRFVETVEQTGLTTIARQIVTDRHPDDLAGFETYLSRLRR